MAGEGWAARVMVLVRERPFWVVQAGVALAAGSHALTEFSGGHIGPEALWHELAGLTAFLYLFPVSYAALRYGTTGGVVVSVEILILTIPNLVLSHPGAFGWFGETVSLLIVFAVGLGFGFVGSRLQAARDQAEEVGSRLVVLNDVAGSLARAGDPVGLVQSVLSSMVGSLPVDGAVFFPTEPLDVVPESVGAGPAAIQRRIRDAAPLEHKAFDGGHTFGLSGGLVVVPVVGSRNLHGALALAVPPGTPALPSDLDVLQAIADELALALEYAHLQASERDRLRQYGRDITRAQEDERLRVARDLHDDAAQALVVLARRLRRLAGSDDVTVSGAEETGALEDATLAIQESIRLTSASLRSLVLDDLGLEAAIGSLVAGMEAGSASDISFTTNGKGGRISSDIELAAFRITQEALRNAVRHSGARHIEVTLDLQEECASVGVTDDGCGFAESAIDSGGLGLTGMRERAQAVGGSLAIDSTPGGGATIRFEVADCR